MSFKIKETKEIFRRTDSPVSLSFLDPRRRDSTLPDAVGAPTTVGGGSDGRKHEHDTAPAGTAAGARDAEVRS